MDATTIGLIGFVICLIASRILSERAFRSLPDEQKVALMNAFSGMRAYALIPLLAILAVMFGLPRLFPGNPHLGLYIGLILLAAYVLFMHVLIVRRLQALQLGGSYQQQFLLARHINHAGMFILVGCLLFDTFQ